MKFIPKKLFRSKKTRSVSRSDDPSFSSGSTTSSSENSIHKPNNGVSTPTSVLPTLSNEIEWSEISAAAASDGDGDGDGRIRKEQLEAILSRLGEPPSEEEVMLLLNEDFETVSSASAAAEDGGDELKVAFDFFDADHDGKITAEELFNVFRIIGDARCTLEDCKHMIRGVDKNGVGFVCFDDFCLMMEQQLI